MDLLQWNINGIRARLPDLRALMQYHNLAIICLQETHLCPAYSLNFCGFTACHYDHLDGDRDSSRTAVLVNDYIYSTVTLQTQLQASAVHLPFTSLPFTLCNVYLTAVVLIDQGELNNLVSQLPPPFILLGNLNSKNILWGSVLTSDRQNSF
jgi:exonuclease III